MAKTIILLSFLLPSLAYAKLSNFHVISPKWKSAQLKEVCDFMGYKNSPLVSGDSLTKIDCMGRKVSASEYCQRKYPDSSDLLRGVVDAKTKRVLCQFGEGLVFSYNCDNLGVCQKSAKSSCEVIRKKVAMNTFLTRSSFSDGKNKKLSCYFTSKLGQLVPLEL